MGSIAYAGRHQAGSRPERRGSLQYGLLNWLGRIGERSGQGRQAAAYRRLNALDDAQLARMDMRRSDLLERCFGWRAYY